MTLRAGVAKLAGAALAGSLLIVAAPAAAKPCHPHHGSGNSEVAQYLETVPGPCGDQPVGGNGSGHHGNSSGPGGGSGSNAAGLPPGTISELEGFGPAGAQAVSFAEQTSPPGAPGGKASGGSRGGSGAEQNASDGGGGSFLSALAHAVTGNQASASDAGQGLGTLLPILLGVVMLGGFATLALRRGRTG